MELFINDTPIGVSPQEGDTIRQVLDAVLKELDPGLIIAVLIIDQEYQSMDDPAVLSIPVSTINKVELTVATRIELGLALLEDGKQFILIGAQELANGSVSKKKELLNSFVWILDSLEALRNSLPFPPTDLSILKAILTNILKKLDQDHIPLDQTKVLSEQLTDLAMLFDALKEKLTNESLLSKESSYDALRNIQETLVDLATYFQTGQDVLAIQHLCKVIDVLEMFVRYTALNPKDTELEQQSIQIKDLSLQLLNAFENKDFVLIADLIEYDLSEYIDHILENA